MILIGRKQRIWYPGAIYHVMNRGNHKNDIFRDEEDYIVFLNLLGFTHKRYPFFLISYCLMTNHIHLQIETISIPLWTIMHHLLTNYSKYYNEKYNITGHLFQGRYTAEIIEDDAYLLQTSRYIHLNPVKAKIVEKPIEYPWSSYNIFIGVKKNDLVYDYKILDYFTHSRNLYKAFVENNIHEEDMSVEVKRYEMEV